MTSPPRFRAVKPEELGAPAPSPAPSPEAADTPRKPGRPATGRTPDAERKRLSRARKLQAGAHTIGLELDPPAAADLATAMLEGGHATAKAAVQAALAEYVARLRRQK